VYITSKITLPKSHESNPPNFDEKVRYSPFGQLLWRVPDLN
jgi:hypothetical protein